MTAHVFASTRSLLCSQGGAAAEVLQQLLPMQPHATCCQLSHQSTVVMLHDFLLAIMLYWAQLVPRCRNAPGLYAHKVFVVHVFFVMCQCAAAWGNPLLFLPFMNLGFFGFWSKLVCCSS